MTPSSPPGKRLRLALVIVLVATSCDLTAPVCGARDMAAGITASTIRRVQIGMRRDEVERILGAPFAETARQYPAPDGGSVTLLEYSRPVRGARWYPMLWVHIERGAVIEVYAKRYVDWGTDDEGVYSRLPEREDLENSPAFEATFGR